MSKLTKFIFASDSHGDMADPEALAALYEFTKDFGGSSVLKIAGGDQYDFRSLRKGVGTDKEGAESLQADIEEGKDFFTRWRPNVWLWGNHEHRLDAAQGSGSALVRDYCQGVKDHVNAHARKCGAKVILPYHADKGVYRVGPVAMIHGYAHGANSTVVQGLHYSPFGGALIHGHTHNLASIALTKHGGGNAFSAGCLCRKEDMAYSAQRLASARWGSGWVAGFVTAGGEYKAWLVHKMGDQWIWTTDLKTFTPRS
jgi:hypothetical protein